MVAQYLIHTTAIVAVFAVNAGQFLPQQSNGNGDLVAFIKKALDLAISLAALIAVGMLIYSGILYITAAGDDGKIEKATKGITYAVIGLIISFISVIIVQFVMKNILATS